MWTVPSRRCSGAGRTGLPALLTARCGLRVGVRGAFYPRAVPPNRPAFSQAFADESFYETDHGGFYVLAAAVFEPAVYEGARAAMVELRGKHIGKLHWSKMDAQEQRNAAKRLAGLDGLHLVTVGAPVPRKRQERARAMCLTTLSVELYGYGVTELLMESRTPQLDQRDVRTVAGVRQRLLPRGAEFRVDHQPGAAEPLFWSADIVAGAVRAHREGNPFFRELLRDRIYEIDVATGC